MEEAERPRVLPAMPGSSGKPLLRGLTRPFGRFSRWLDNRSELTTAYLYLAPTLLLLLCTVVFPIGYSLFLSFTKMEFAGGAIHYSFVGLDNYLGMLKDPRVGKIVSNTVSFTFLKVVLTLLLAFGIALIVYLGVWGAGFFKRLFLIPWALSNVVNSLMWKWMYSGDNGIVNELLTRAGWLEKYRMWLIEPQSAMGAVLFADIWKSTPYVALMLLAAMQSIPKDLHESAKMDGAGAFVTFSHIIFPLIKPVLMITLIIETMWTLRVFDIIWILTEGGPQDSTMILNTYAYEQAFRHFEFGYAAAISYIITLITVILTVVYMKALDEH
ncbi:carbohydrate ABC transporter permease [Paenibacillus hamazuiensis]|uniref:carbohydrate ABC transporter permease n=1 Tax=Paenibacillus hamazuiensis TaxID=2936508 RepID=UPI00200F894A|nr:sugar ABC transporter permease [Paenibacillus hamazuiensis]